jgi:hypothetical protein
MLNYPKIVSSVCEVWGSESRDYKSCCLVRCGTMFFQLKQMDTDFRLKLLYVFVMEDSSLFRTFHIPE